MSRVIIFSRFFPTYHPRKGEPTYFVDKIWASIVPPVSVMANYYAKADGIHYMRDPGNGENFEPKHHTIRAGNRWKVGDKFSPRIWSGKPYRSKQIIIGPDIEVKKIWPIHFYGMTKYIGDCIVNDYELNEVALNDGLSLMDFKDWFNKFPFHGQLISWAEHIKY